jgi:FtsP/CotA-like multicopper oxidase with cupredoxin domain
MTLTRRELLLGGAVLVGGGLVLPFGSSASSGTVSTLAPANTPKPFTARFTPSPQLRGRVVAGTLPDGSQGLYRLFTVIQKQLQASILPGLRTPLWGYGYVDDSGVERAPRVPGPTIDVDRTGANGGLPVKVRVINRLPAKHPQWGHDFITSNHLHGSASLPQYDGYADDVTYPGQYKDYWYPNFQDARTLWYHDHAVHSTAWNAYGGLAAQYHLHDRVQERDLPAGAYDVGLTITDAMFGADGKLAWDDRDSSGLWGDVILVNGQPWPVMQVQRRVYRFRILNASISRSYRLHLSDSSQFAVIGTDGGLMPAPAYVREYRHGGAERYELLIDFGRYPVGAKVNLLNRSNTNNVDYDNTNKVMQFQVVDGVFPTTRNTMSPRLPVHEVMSTPVSDSKRTRVFELDHDDVTNTFKIDGRTWDEVQHSGFTAALTGGTPAGNGDVEIWEWRNNSGGWFHPLHIHLVDFRVLSRNGQAAYPYENGPKDVVYIGEDEVVRMLIKFRLPPGIDGGKYMVHCHNLPHEDNDMMHQFVVGQPAADDDPRGGGMLSVRAQPVRGPIGTDGDLVLYGDGTLA